MAFSLKAKISCQLNGRNEEWFGMVGRERGK
jgi:hypothetical protein